MRAAARILASATAIGTGTLLLVISQNRNPTKISPEERLRQKQLCEHIPSREKQVERLKAGEEYDLLVIGGGATGTGVALDAATRGLKVALVERGDFSCATSSKSTKLIHGGVRYLEKAILGLDYEQYQMVREALVERSMLLTLAPHLTCEIPIMIPIYSWWKVPYYFAGSKFYDLVAGTKGLESSYFLTKRQSLDTFPMISQSKLKGSMVYFDGQSNDARMNVALALTAAAYGASIANYVNVESLIKEKDADGKEVVRGAVVKDSITGEKWQVKAKGVINATGPFTDAIRKMDDEKSPNIVAPSAGTHIILPDYYSPSGVGLLDPATKDGRVVFFLPWEGSVLAGTTDIPTKVDPNLAPTEEEILYIIEELSKYLNGDLKVGREDVLSAWAGIRPLVRDPSKTETSELVRNHIVHTSPSKLITISGGKWTTYRSMARETVDEALKVLGLNPEKKPSMTERIYLVGAHGYSKMMYVNLIKQFGLETSIAKHLAKNYGDKAFDVAKLSKDHKRLSRNYPFLEAEVIYAVQHEYAQTAADVLGRRTRLAFLNAKAALEATPRVVEIMAKELGWSKERKEKEVRETLAFLKTMGLSQEQLEKGHA